MTLQPQEQEFDLSEQLHHNADPLGIQRFPADGFACSVVLVSCIALIAFLAMQVDSSPPRPVTLQNRIVQQHVLRN